MRVSVFGLGYVGAVSAACLAADGHEVVGADKNTSKVELMNSGKSPIIEMSIDAMIRSAHSEGRLRATTEAAEAIRSTELSLVCVGTPSESNGNLSLANVRNVSSDIGAALRTLERYHIVVIRSTVLPGTVREVVIPELERAWVKRWAPILAYASILSFCGKGRPSRTITIPQKQ